MTFLKLTQKNVKPTIKPVISKKEAIKLPESPLMGVYCIKNLIDNKYYVGSSKNIDTRIKTHKQHLLKGCHNCRVLQKDFDKLGEENFKFDILEIVNDELLLTAYEKYYIYKLDAIVKYKGYNEIFPTLNHKLFKEVYIKKEQQNLKQNLKTSNIIKDNQDIKLKDTNTQ